MYSEWSSLVGEIREEVTLDNVLNAYPLHTAKDVATIILKSLTEPPRAKDLPISLTTHEQVKWTMDVISYGLSLPISEQKLMHLCIDVYESWLSTIHQAKKSVPRAVKEAPDEYVPIIFKQLSQVFTLRPETAPPASASLSNSTIQLLLDNQALLCKRVLTIFHQAVMDARTKLSRETWDCLLLCLLRINDIILAPPIEPNSIAAILKSFPVHVLFEAWLRACTQCFPRPQLWKSLHELCRQWRHHGVLAIQWTSLVYTLTFNIIGNLYTQDFLKDIHPSTLILDANFERLVREMPYDVLVQCWYRILHTLGNPVELSYPHIIAGQPAFQKHSSEGDTHHLALHRSKQHLPSTQSSLTALPRIYHELMRGVARLVYLFLGQDVGYEWDEIDTSTSGVDEQLRRHDSIGRAGQGFGGKLIKQATRSHWYVNPVSSLGQPPKTPPVLLQNPRTTSHTTMDLLGSLAEVARPKGNTLLHLFGGWLFQAAIWPPSAADVKDTSDFRQRSRSTISSFSDLSQSIKPAQPKQRDPDSLLRYEKGRAEAFGALCSIFSSQPCGEPFHPVFLAKFYHALILGLSYSSECSNGHILTEIILHSSGLLRKDLTGINLVLPYFVDALKLILPCHAPPFKWVVNLQELRHASINLLLSMLSLPLHFLNQPLPNVFSAVPNLLSAMPSFAHQKQQRQQRYSLQEEGSPPTFYSLKDHLLALIIKGIPHETDHINKQLLLHAFNVIILDIVTYENSLNKVSEESQEEEEELLKGHTSKAEISNHSIAQSSESPPSVLVGEAIRICKTSLCPSESECGDTPVCVSLAALELLSSIAMLQFENFSHNDSRYAVHLVSEYIEAQAMQDLPKHSRDLHTSIVAAFSTLLVWIQTHPYLLGSKNSLSSVMKVIELGISGKFSMEPDGEIIYKGDKKERPISGRVKEIAEFMLFSVMENINAFPSPCGAESSSSLLSEEEILNRLPPERKDVARFQYFLLDNSVLLGLLEEPFPQQLEKGEHGKPLVLPTVTAVVRGPSGRHIWSMQLRHHPRSEQPSTTHQHSVSRPHPKPHPPISSSCVRRKPWPDEVELEPSTEVDMSIPKLDDVLKESSRTLYNKMFQLVSNQVETEESINKEFIERLKELPFPNPATAMEPPRVQEKFKTARLFLNHLGLLGLEGVKETSTGLYQPLVVLNSLHPNFSSSLSSLDRLPSRFCNTIFVLHCKEGLTKVEDILAAQSSLSNKPQEFLEFLNGLGWIVNPKTHPGFTGRIRSPKTEDSSRPVGLSAQILSRPFPYYTDAMTELAFIVPTLRPSAGDSSASLRSVESSDSGQDVSAFQAQSLAPLQPPLAHQVSQPSISHSQPPSSSHPPGPQQDSMYVNIDSFAPKDSAGSGVAESAIIAEGFSTYPGKVKKHSRTDVLGVGGSETPKRRWALPQDGAAMVVWLEKFDDHSNFPVEVLSRLLHGASLSGMGSHKMSHHAASKKSIPVIFIHKMSSGLYQIYTNYSGGRPDSVVGPLVDGMVVSRRTLSVLVRQTAVNMCSRHRMENEGFSPPHVKRKRKLEEMAKAFKLPLSVAEFYSRLFTDQSDTL